MRALVLIDALWIGVLVVFALLLFRVGSQRAELKDEAARIRRELGLIERAVEKAAEAEPAPPGQPIPFERYRAFIEGGGKRLREKGLDPFGHPYGAQVPGSPPAVPAASADHLRAVADEAFWAPYPVARR